MSARRKINSTKLWEGLNLVRKPVSDPSYWEKNNKHKLGSIKELLPSNISDIRDSFNSLSVDWNSQDYLSSIFENEEDAYEKTKPYLNFFYGKLPLRELVTWPSAFVDSLPADVEVFTLEKRDKNLFDKIFGEFAEWAADFDKEYDEEKVQEMKDFLNEIFSINLKIDMERSTVITVKDSIKDNEIRDFDDFKQLVESYFTAHTLIDLDQETIDTRINEFIESLPDELKMYSTSNNQKNKWLSDLTPLVVTSGDIWEEICDLESTKKFCHWLKENNENPLYLRDQIDKTQRTLENEAPDEPEKFPGDLEIRSDQ